MAVTRALRLALASASAALAACELGPVAAIGFGSHIEGASVDAAGSVYATHFRGTEDNSFEGNQGGRNVIGRIDATTGEASAFFEGEPGAEFNGMRWTADGSAVFLADVGQSKVVRVNLATMTGEDYCGGAGSTLDGTGAPNDMALAKSGLLFLSGQQWEGSTGGLWLCRPDNNGGGQLVELEGNMARTNGIALSLDDRTLYLTEAVGSPVQDASSPVGQRIWRYNVAADGSVTGKVEFFNFATGTASPEANADSDGMRTDAAGNLYVARNGRGKVAVISPAGDLVTELQLSSIVHATNLAFGGTDGKTLYVVGRCGHASWGSGDGCVESVTAREPGREWTWLRSSSPPVAPPATSAPSSTPAPTTAEPPCVTKTEPATPAPSTAEPSTMLPSTTAPSTTPAPTTSPATTVAGDHGACSGEWQQCGGQDWSGPTCCEHGLTCNESGPYYSQCLRPGALAQQAQQRKVQSHQFLRPEHEIGSAPVLLQSAGVLQRPGETWAEL